MKVRKSSLVCSEQEHTISLRYYDLTLWYIKHASTIAEKRLVNIWVRYRIVFFVVRVAHYFSFLCGVRLRSTYSVPNVSCVSVHY